MLLATAVAALVAAPASAGVLPEAPKSAPTDLYLVQVDGEPLASYTGGVKGLPATRPAQGGKVDARSAAAKEYRAELKKSRDDVRRRGGISGVPVLRDYGVAFNGFATRLTPAQVSKLRRTPGVLGVWKNEIRKADTVSTPEMLGLEGKDGVWNTRFGGDARAGEGVIVGVLDTGIWPENPSFAALPEPRPDARAISSKWKGTCDRGETGRIACNNKVIGARWYNASGLGDQLDGEFKSPRDFGGHGSHTASTSAGNHGVTAAINGLTVGTASGMAPAARIAVYKVLWQQPDGGGSGGTVDLVAAIDDAVADGVDVINYSISGSQTSFVDPVELAFLGAADAGVFVAASAGNSGPGASTVAHNSPWVTTVAASTHDRSSPKSVTLGKGQTYAGIGVGPAVASTGLVDAGAAVKAGESASDAELCKAGSLDPAKVIGKVVLCKRGDNARIDKSRTVRDAGGVGMVHYNDPDNSLNADFHFVPTVHVNSAAGLAIKAYAATAGATASLSESVSVKARAPEMAAFSSAGPARAGAGDLLKPDITAPGVDVIAAVAPPGNNDNNWDAYSGTSMSSPHIAGLAALLIGKNPTWSPIWVKSALMTSAGQKDNAGEPIQRAGRAATPLDFGAGHVRPAESFTPGLVYSSGKADWEKFLCGTGQRSGKPQCARGSIDPSDLNYPSISIGALPGEQTVTRAVTNVTGRDQVFTAKVEAPAGYSVAVAPERLTIKKGQSAKFTVKVTRTTGTLGQWAFGSLTWQAAAKDLTDVRSPIAVRGVAVATPGEVTGTGATGSTTLKVKTGYTGTLTAQAAGVVPANTTTMELVGVNTSFDPNRPATGPAVGKVTVEVPAGSKLARFATYDADYGVGTDLDLFVYNASGQLVGSSASGTSEESVTLSAAGTYSVYVVQYALPTGQTKGTVKHYDWVVGPATGNLTATPASQQATTGGDATVTLAWNSLTAGGRYLGVLSLGDGTNEIGRTIVTLRP
ncbi:S8 family serine peptidase [Actinopolymorpha alba]|uniref:S8 family serine peptidase n=1 Tax=Actinopolymorpha alba TaxID=533267 RepID=UPI000367FDBE|nr:S8 family serine peptidase [Actinopolymorpha alba]